MNAAVETLQRESAATATRFVDNGDGTVTDTTTGLMWSKAPLTEEAVDHEQAGKVCAELALAGHTDWRLPTVEELFALADRSIETNAFPGTQSDWYWTSTITAWSSGLAWFAVFDNGLASSGLLRGVNYAFVRAVRSVPDLKGYFLALRQAAAFQKLAALSAVTGGGE